MTTRKSELDDAVFSIIISILWTMPVHIFIYFIIHDICEANHYKNLISLLTDGSVEQVFLCINILALALIINYVNLQRLSDKKRQKGYYNTAISIFGITLIAINVITALLIIQPNIIGGVMKELQNILLAMSEQSSTILSIFAIGAAVISFLGASVAFIDRYSKAQKYDIPHSLLRTDIRDYADVLLNLIILVGMGIVLPLWFITVSPNGYACAFISLPVTIVFAIFTTIRYRLAKSRKRFWTVIVIMMLLTLFGQYFLFEWVNKSKHEYLAILGNALPIYALMESIKFVAMRFKDNIKTVLMKHNNKLYILVAKHDATKWIAVPCKKTEDGGYCCIAGSYLLVEANGNLCRTISSSDIRIESDG